jgi:hypothetical protein
MLGLISGLSLHVIRGPARSGLAGSKARGHERSRASKFSFHTMIVYSR